MAETWYEVKPWLDYSITPIEVDGFTDKSIFIANKHTRIKTRQARHSDFSSVFPTLTEAVAFSRTQLEQKIASLEGQLAKHKALVKYLAELPA